MNTNELDLIIKKNYPIQTWINNPILRTKITKISKSDIVSAKVKEFSKILFRAMEIYDWIWLAAPQIWELLRMIAICQFDKKWKNILRSDVLINPEIIFKDWEYISDEACLSLPWLEWKVKRVKKIKVKFFDINWKLNIIEAYDLNAAIIQHEIDHLDWILFRDKVINKQSKINLNKIILS